MSFRSILSGYPKILNVWSIYLQYLNNRASKQNKELLGFVYEHIPYISLKQQNQYAEHVSISYYFLIQYVLSSKSSLNCFTTFGSSVCQGSLSWVHTIWHCNLPVAWSTLCHCWGDSQPNVNHCLFLFDLKVTGNLCTTRLDPEARPSTLWGLNSDPSNSQCNHLSHCAVFPSF